MNVERRRPRACWIVLRTSDVAVLIVIDGGREWVYDRLLSLMGTPWMIARRSFTFICSICAGTGVSVAVALVVVSTSAL